MIKVQAQADGELQILVQHDDLNGQFVGINLDDHQGLQLWLDVAAFYKAKGHDMERILGATPVAAPGILKRLGMAWAFVTGG